MDFTKGEGPQNGGSAAVGMNLAMWAIHGLAAAFQPLTRVPGSCGSNYFGVTGVVGWVMACLALGRGQTELERRIALGYCGLLTAALLAHRIASLARHWRGDAPHSMYVGESWLRRLLPRLGRDWCRGPGELAVGLLAGMLLAGPAPAVGSFVITAAIASTLSLMLVHAREERQLERLRDARIESESLAARFRERYGDREDLA